jgi:hypothetical protein
MTTRTANAFSHLNPISRCGDTAKALSSMPAVRFAEVGWVPFYTAAIGVLALGLVMVAAGPGAAVPGEILTVTGVILALVGWLEARRKRVLLVRASNEVYVLRGESAGPSFRTGEVQSNVHRPAVTCLYFVLGLTVGNAALKIFSADALSAAGLSWRELLGFGGGLLIEALFAVAVWRRAVCTEIRVPGEMRSLWVRSSDARQLGIRDTVAEAGTI